MRKLLPCQVELLLTKEFHKDCESVLYMCKNCPEHTWAVNIAADEISTEEDIAYMDAKVLEGMSAKCESCSLSRNSYK